MKKTLPVLFFLLIILLNSCSPLMEDKTSGKSADRNQDVSSDTPQDIPFGYTLDKKLCVSSQTYTYFDPESLTVDKDGNILVLQWNKIAKFNSNKELILEFSGDTSTDSVFGNSTGITTDNSGDIFVCDADHHRILKFDPNGHFLFKFGSKGTANSQFNTPNDIKLDKNGNIYVADCLNNRVQKFNSSGVFLMKFGSSGTANGQFGGAYKLDLDSSGNIYVSDMLNNRIQKFNSSGVFQMKFGSYGTGAGQIGSYPTVRLDSSGNIYVMDHNNRVQKFNSSGIFQKLYGGFEGLNFGEFRNMDGFFIDKNDHLWITDTMNNRITELSSNGSYLSYLGNLPQISSPRSISIDPDGNIFIADNHILKFNSSGNFTAVIGYKTGGTNPSGVVSDSSGNIYVTDSYLNTFSKYNILNGLVFSKGTEGNAVDQFNSPAGLAMDNTGDLYICDRTNKRIQIYNQNGFYQRGFDVTAIGDGLYDSPYKIAIDGDVIYHIDSNQNRIIKTDLRGNYIMHFSPAGLKYANSIYCLAARNNEVILATSMGGLRRYNSDGILQSEIKKPVPDESNSNSFLLLTFDPDGNLYAGNTQGIYKMIKD